jgi:putative redox protein
MVIIELKRLNDAFHLEAANEIGNTVQIDAAPDIGGTNQGMRPMQMLLAVLGGCSTIDVISILKKQKQDVKDIRITVTGERDQDAIPSLYKDVHILFKLYGNLDEDKVRKAVSLSVDKYCSVARILEKTATITYGFEILAEISLPR